MCVGIFPPQNWQTVLYQKKTMPTYSSPVRRLVFLNDSFILSKIMMPRPHRLAYVCIRLLQPNSNLLSPPSSPYYYLLICGRGKDALGYIYIYIYTMVMAGQEMLRITRLREVITNGWPWQQLTAARYG